MEPQNLTDLHTIEINCWQLLSQAVTDRKHPMRTVTIGYISHNKPQIRTVVFRKVDVQKRKLFFHTDIRSKKINSINTNNQLSWLAYDSSLRTQIILTGSTVIHYKNELTKIQWGNTQHSSRRCYLLSSGPGNAITEEVKSTEEKLKNFSYTMEESEIGFENFAVIETTVEEMDWYNTFHLGNRRAHFYYENGMLKAAEWLTP
jgi:3-hydroxyisobutyrate dehydrogenase